MRIGYGYDVHPLVKGRKLILGGVKIPFEKGLKGHSDADVLLHAVCDALLGAMAAGDIGQHFPNTSAKYKNISSLVLLKEVYKIMKSGNFNLGNIDATIVADKPLLGGYFLSMRENIAQTLRAKLEKISIKATTSEGLGFIGQGKGMAAYVVALIEESKK
jgi:2-C-methyl-D-erythritol 2,4-cyclodiphosphate synthase